MDEKIFFFNCHEHRAYYQIANSNSLEYTHISKKESISLDHHVNSSLNVKQ